MDTVGGCCIWCINRAKPRTARAIIPIRQAFDPEFIMDFEILAMRLGDVFGGRALHVVAVHEDWHDRLSRPGAHGAGRMFWLMRNMLPGSYLRNLISASRLIAGAIDVFNAAVSSSGMKLT